MGTEVQYLTICSTYLENPIRLFHDGAIQVNGHMETMRILHLGFFAYIADDITGSQVIANSFGSHGVCKFYLTPEPLQFHYVNQMMIFPVSYRIVI